MKMSFTLVGDKGKASFGMEMMYAVYELLNVRCPLTTTLKLSIKQEYTENWN